MTQLDLYLKTLDLYIQNDYTVTMTLFLLILLVLVYWGLGGLLNTRFGEKTEEALLGLFSLPMLLISGVFWLVWYPFKMFRNATTK